MEKSFLPSCFEIRREGSFWMQQRNWKHGKNLPYNISLLCKHWLACILLIETLSRMYFTVNLKLKKPTLCCSFTWIIFIELNLTIVFLSIRKAWVSWFFGKVGGWRILRNGRWRYPGNRGRGGWYPFTDYGYSFLNCMAVPLHFFRKNKKILFDHTAHFVLLDLV